MKTFFKRSTALKSKSIVVMTAFLFVSISLFAQTDSGASTDIITTLFNLVVNLVPASTWAIIFFSCFVLDFILDRIKWVPANHTLALIYIMVKKVVDFLGGKFTMKK